MGALVSCFLHKTHMSGEGLPTGKQDPEKKNTLCSKTHVKAWEKKKLEIVHCLLPSA